MTNTGSQTALSPRRVWRQAAADGIFGQCARVGLGSVEAAGALGRVAGRAQQLGARILA